MRLVNKIIFFICALILLMATNSFAATYYVDDTGGDDGRTAEQAQVITTPWATIGKCEDEARAGDTCFIRSGTYAATITCGYSGTDGSPITFAAYQGESVTTCGWDISTKNYIRIIGFTINCDTGACSASDNGIALSGTNIGIEIWNNDISECDQYDGIRIPGSAGNTCSQCLFIGNTIHDCDSGGSSSGIRYVGNNSVIAYNTISAIDTDGILNSGNTNFFLNNYIYGLIETAGHPDMFQGTYSTAGYSSNVIEATMGIGGGSANEHGVLVQNSAQVSIFTNNVYRRNLFHNLGSMTIQYDDAAPGMTGTRVYHNTDVEGQRSVNTDIGHYFANAADYTYILNNLEYESWYPDDSTNIRVYSFTNNYSLGYNLSYDPDGSVTLSAPWTGSGTAQSNVNPSLTDVAGDDFTLGLASGASNVGGALTYVTSANGTGTAFAVNDAGFFRGDNSGVSQYAGALIVGDTILVGTDTVVISAISGNTITASSSFTWVSGESVYYGTDSTPDIGAYPYRAAGYTLTATYTNSGGNITVTPSSPDLVRWVICYDDGIPSTVDNSSPYTCSVTGTPTVKVYALYPSKTPVIDATLTSSSSTGRLGIGVTLEGGNIK